jgi:hypothetical protein
MKNKGDREVGPVKDQQSFVPREGLPVTILGSNEWLPRQAVHVVRMELHLYCLPNDVLPK